MTAITPIERPMICGRLGAKGYVCGAMAVAVVRKKDKNGLPLAFPYCQRHLDKFLAEHPEVRA